MAKETKSKLMRAAVVAYKNAFKACKEASEAAQKIQVLMKEGPTDHEPADAIDACYLMQEARDMAETTRKVLEASRKVISRIHCVRALEVALRVKSSSAKPAEFDAMLRGKLASATVKQTQCFNLPPDNDKNKVTYENMMRELGASEMAIENKLLEPRWRHTMDWLTRKVQRGEQLPRSIEGLNSFDESDLSLRRTKVDVDSFVEAF